MFLGLNGQARRLMSGIKPAAAEGYHRLREALLLRYEPYNQNSREFRPTCPPVTIVLNPSRSYLIGSDILVSNCTLL